VISDHRPMTAKQLKDVVAQYSSAFPGWTIFQDVALIRESGPIQQMIWFQKMNYAAYRPTHVIKALPISMPRMLTQHLDVRHREIKYSLQESKWLGVVSAMEQQFKPDIRKSLEISDVLSLCEAEARQTTNDLTMLAILHAWLGHKAEAIRCCEQMQHSELPKLAPIPEWEEAMRNFGSDLAIAVQMGNERALLECRAQQ
jgi:hypothetical protein